MEKFGKFWLVMLLFVAVTFEVGLEAFMAWNWVATSVFGVSPMTYFGAVGLGMIVGWLAFHFKNNVKAPPITAEYLKDAFGRMIGRLAVVAMVFGTYKIFFS